MRSRVEVQTTMYCPPPPPPALEAIPNGMVKIVIPKSVKLNKEITKTHSEGYGTWHCYGYPEPDLSYYLIRK